MAQETFLKEAEALREMRALEAIERDPSVSQRELAAQLGVAVGVANACVRTLVRKGMIKIRGETNRSITYHITKAGFVHKSRLAVEWTRNTVGFYRQARTDVAGHLVRLAAEGIERAVLLGTNELAEIVAIVAPEAGIELLGVIDIDGSHAGPTIAGIAVIAPEDAVDRSPQALIVCDEDATDVLVARVRSSLGDLRLASFTGRRYEGEDL